MRLRFLLVAVLCGLLIGQTVGNFYVGCFKASLNFVFATSSRDHMDIPTCIARCGKESYPLAGLHGGDACSCGGKIGHSDNIYIYTTPRSRYCNVTCSDPAANRSLCGGEHEYSVYTTGANYALHKNAYSDTADETVALRPADLKLTTDGDMGSCSTQKYKWWRVDLGQIYDIDRVILKATTYYFFLAVSNTTVTHWPDNSYVCYTYSNSVLFDIEKYIPCVGSGRYVVVGSQVDTFTLCEVQVYGLDHKMMDDRAVQNGDIPWYYIGVSPTPTYPDQISVLWRVNQCPEGWIASGTKCFRFYEEKVAFPVALAHCRSLSASGNLASIHSRAEHDEAIAAIRRVTSMSGSADHEDAWIGLNRTSSGNKWTDYSPYDYRNWPEYTPDIHDKPCAIVGPTWDSSVYLASKCSTPRPYICQKGKITMCQVIHDGKVFPDTQVKVEQDGDSFMPKVDGMQYFTKHNIRVLACAKEGVCDSTPTVTVTMGEGKPGEFKIMSATAKTHDRILVRWQSPRFTHGNITYYIILNPSLASGKNRFPASPAQRIAENFTVTGLAENTMYRVSAEVCNSAACTPSYNGIIVQTPFDSAYLRVIMNYQSSYAGSSQPKDALDGLTYTCTSTNKQDFPYFLLDLGSVVAVDSILIYPKSDLSATEQNNLYIGLTNSSFIEVHPYFDTYYICANVTKVLAKGTTTTIPCFGAARYVTIHRYSRQVALQLCEVRVGFKSASTLEKLTLPGDFIVWSDAPGTLRIKRYFAMAYNLTLFLNGKVMNKKAPMDTVVSGLETAKIYLVQFGECNPECTGYSKQVFGKTMEGTPEIFGDPRVKYTHYSMINIQWEPPMIANGVLHYKLYANGKFMKKASPKERRWGVELSNMDSRNMWSIRIDACTSSGCISSNDVTAFQRLEGKFPAGGDACAIPNAMTGEWLEMYDTLYTNSSSSVDMLIHRFGASGSSQTVVRRKADEGYFSTLQGPLLAEHPPAKYACNLGKFVDSGDGGGGQTYYQVRHGRAETAIDDCVKMSVAGNVMLHATAKLQTIWACSFGWGLTPNTCDMEQPSANVVQWTLETRGGFDMNCIKVTGNGVPGVASITTPPLRWLGQACLTFAARTFRKWSEDYLSINLLYHEGDVISSFTNLYVSERFSPANGWKEHSMPILLQSLHQKIEFRAEFHRVHSGPYYSNFLVDQVVVWRGSCDKVPRDNLVTARCPHGWTASSTKCLLFQKEIVPYSTALGNCGRLGGTLVSIRDHAEHTKVEKVMSGGGSSSAWIGLRKNKVQCSDEACLLDGWRWTNEGWLGGANYQSYSNWRLDSHSQHLSTPSLCAALTAAEQSSGWDMLNCSESRPYVCERFNGLTMSDCFKTEPYHQVNAFVKLQPRGNNSSLGVNCPFANRKYHATVRTAGSERHCVANSTSSIEVRGSNMSISTCHSRRYYTNVAQGKLTSASSTYWRMAPYRAVDGSRSTDPSAFTGSCFKSLTAPRSAFTPPWWMVDLGPYYYIQEVHILNQNGSAMWYPEFVVKVSNQSSVARARICSKKFGLWSATGVVVVRCVDLTRYVSIAYAGESYIASFSLCEVRVMGSFMSTPLYWKSELVCLGDVAAEAIGSTADKGRVLFLARRNAENTPPFFVARYTTKPDNTIALSVQGNYWGTLQPDPKANYSTAGVVGEGVATQENYAFELSDTAPVVFSAELEEGGEGLIDEEAAIIGEALRMGEAMATTSTIAIVAAVVLILLAVLAYAVVHGKRSQERSGVRGTRDSTQKIAAESKKTKKARK